MPRVKRIKKAEKIKKQIILKKNTAVKKRSGAQTTTATNPFTTGIKKIREEQKVFFGLDLHKRFLQIAAADQEGSLLMSKRVESDFRLIEQEFSVFPKMPNTCWNHHLCGMAYTKTYRGSGSGCSPVKSLFYVPHSKIQKEDRQV